MGAAALAVACGAVLAGLTGADAGGVPVIVAAAVLTLLLAAVFVAVLAQFVRVGRFRLIGVTDPRQMRDLTAALRERRAPADPALDEPALRLVAQRESDTGRAARRLPLVAPVGLLPGVIIIATGERAGWAVIGVWIGLTGGQLLAARRERRRGDRVRAAISARTS